MTWEYLAGFFDGEGSISIIGDRDNCRVKICITGTNEQVIKEIATFVSHTYNKKSNSFKAYKPSHRPAFALEICDQQEILKILNSMMPYLIVKKNRAMLMIEYLRGVGGYTPHLTSMMREKRREYAERMRETL